MSGEKVDRQPHDHVDLLGVRFPRLTQDEALALLQDCVARHRTAGFCFPDMSTLNIAATDSGFRRLLTERVQVMNDGAGLAWAAQRRGLPFPANLNGTDLCPRLLDSVRPGTRVFLVGGREGIARRAREELQQRFTRPLFVGEHHGYLDDVAERDMMDELRKARPDIVVVGMGNPTQVRFIDRHLDDPALQGVVWLAVGGLMDYYAGNLRRAPGWARRAGLEWLMIVGQQPHKAGRYFGGIPRFLARCVAAEATGRHDLPLPGDADDVHPPHPAGSSLQAVARQAAAGLAGVLGRARPDEPRILTYHGVCETPKDAWSVTPGQLRRQMRVLARDAHPVSLAEIVTWLRGEGELPPRAVAVTFDDGFTDVLEHAAPILAEAGVPGAAFVSPAFASQGAAAASPDYVPGRPFLDWAQLRELQNAGWTLGSHARTHAVLSRLPENAARSELASSRRELEDRLGVAVGLLAYPFGTPGTVSRRDRDLARDAGYEAAFLAVAGPLRRGTGAFELPRCKILGNDAPSLFNAVVDGRLDWWGMVERTH